MNILKRLDIPKTLLLTALCLGLIAATTELTALVVYYVKTGALFYSRTTTAGAEEKSSAFADTTRLVLHPTISFIRRPGISIREFLGPARLQGLWGPDSEPPWVGLTANNYGFFSPHDYPYQAVGDKFLVGVFGGSFAQWFAIQGQDTLIEGLSAMPELKDRSIEVLNFSQGGYKQPQQAMALMYFLSVGQRLDMVINIDGFNELALSAVNARKGIDPWLPSAQHLLPLYSLINRDAEVSLSETIARVRVRELGAKVRSYQYRTNTANTASTWFFHDAIGKFLARRHERENASLLAQPAIEHSSLVHLNAIDRPAEANLASEQAVRQWEDSSMLIHDILGGRSIPYFHFIQPNQYYSKKKFSEAEKATALNAKSPYGKTIEKAYAGLINAIPSLQDRGVSIWSAVEVFDEVQEHVYADSCCHLNQRGNEILARFVAARIVEDGAAGGGSEARSVSSSRDKAG